jgi:hypothetical protein
VLVLSGSPDLYHHWLTAVAATSACAVLIECRTILRILCAGVCCGFAVCCTPQRGTLLAAGIATFLVIESRQKGVRWRTILNEEFVLLGSSFIVTAAVLGPFIWRVGLELFYNSTVDFILNNYTADSSNNSWKLIPASLVVSSWRLLPFAVPLLANYVIVPAMYILFPIRWRVIRNRLPDTTGARLWLIWTIGVTQLIAVLYAPLPYRVATTSIPAIILLVWVLASSRRLWRISAVVIVFGCLLWIAAVTIYDQVRRPKYFQSRIGIVAMRSADEYEIHEWLRRNTQPDSYFGAERESERTPISRGFLSD